MGFFTGTPERYEQIQNMTPGQQGAAGQGLSAGLKMLNDPQQQFDPAANEQLARRNFEQNTLPMLTSRFTNGGGANSSAFANALGGAGADLETNLAAMRSHMGMQQQQMNNQRMMSLLGLGMQPQFDTAHFQGDQGLFGGMAQGLTQGIGSYISSGAGNDKLFEIMQYLKGMGGGQGSQTGQTFQPQKASTIGSMLSHMMSGARTGSVGGPWGALLGGGMGAFTHMLGGQ